MHNLRMAESGRDYLLQTYLDQISDKVPNSPLTPASSLPLEAGLYPCGVPPQQLDSWTESLAKINQVNTDLTAKEEEMLRLSQRTRSLTERLKSSAKVVPELEEIFR